MDSPSAQHRNSGNKFYKEGFAANISAKTRLDRYSKATNSYYRSLNSAADDKEKTSACKNLGMGYWKMATIIRGNSALGNDKLVTFNFKESMKYLCMAHLSGLKTREGDWLSNVATTIYSVIQDGLEFFSELSHVDRLRGVENFLDSVHIEQYKAEMYLAVAEIVFVHGTEAVFEGDFKVALNDMHSCYTPIQEARRLARGNEALLCDARVLEEDVLNNTCIAESLQARSTGDELLRHLLEDDETVNMDMVFEVIDWYRKAIILTREKDVESEAIALSQIGHVFDKVLKLKYKAKESFMRCVELANSLHPKTFGAEAWFQQCTEALERYQQDELRADDAEKQKEKEPYLKELKPDLDKLAKQKKEGDEKYLRYVYKAHPPKPRSGEAKIDEASLKAKTFKKAFQKAICHYHPDQQKSEEGRRWAILCEEITKTLTAMYELYKL